MISTKFDGQQTKPSTQKQKVEFPIEVFPIKIQDFVNQQSEATGISKAYFAGAVLAAISAAIGNRFHVADQNGYLQIGSLYLVVVGNSSTGKSPAFTQCLVPIHEIELELRAEYLSRGNIDDKLKELLLIDATTESIVQALSNSPNGLLLFRDELVAWISSMTRYSSSSDINFYLEMWSGGFTKTSRIGRSNDVVNNSFLTVLGGTQPKLIHHFAKGNNLNNGFFQRLLFIYPDNVKKAKRSKKKVSKALQVDYSNIIKAIYQLKFESYDSDEKIPTLMLSDEADKRWGTWYDELVDEINNYEDRDHPIISCLGKIEQYCLRFSLILEVVHQICAEEPCFSNISLDSMEKAIQLAEYFKASLFKVFEELTDPTKSYNRKDLAFLKALPDDFDTIKGIEVAQKAGLSKSTKQETLRRAFFRKMKQFIKDGVVERIIKNQYCKLM